MLGEPLASEKQELRIWRSRSLYFHVDIAVAPEFEIE
jgi:hypothetical protein